MSMSANKVAYNPQEIEPEVQNTGPIIKPSMQQKIRIKKSITA